MFKFMSFFFFFSGVLAGRLFFCWRGVVDIYIYIYVYINIYAFLFTGGSNHGFFPPEASYVDDVVFFFSDLFVLSGGP